MLFSKKYGCGKCGLHFKDRDDLLKHVQKHMMENLHIYV